MIEYGNWFKCAKCLGICEFIGIGTYALLMVDDPEAGAVLTICKMVYKKAMKYIDSSLTEEEFYHKTFSLLGDLSDIEFLAIYPKRVCEWFGYC